MLRTAKPSPPFYRPPGSATSFLSKHPSMGAKGQKPFELESAIGAIHSLMAALQPGARDGAEALLHRLCRQLKCGCAVYACVEEASGKIGIRAAHNLPRSKPSLCELACRICSRIISDPAPEAVRTLGFQEMSRDVGAQAPGGPAFKSAIGYPIRLGGLKGTAVAVLDASARSFSDQERLLVAVSGMLLGIEGPRRQAAASFENACQKLSPTEIRVAELIRQGRVSKEIAQELNITVRSVEVHRYHIRKKLGLKSLKINLQRYLAEKG